MKSAGKARNNGLYRHIRTSKEIIRNLLNDYYKNKKETKQGREAQQGRVMHERARGHEVERSHSHFLYLKTI